MTKDPNQEQKQEQEHVLGFDPEFTRLQWDDPRIDMQGVLKGPEPSFLDERFSQLEGRYEVKLDGLKAMLENPSLEDLIEASKNSHDPKLREKLAAELKAVREEAAAKEFVQNCPAYYPTDANYDTLLEYLDEHDLEMTQENLQKAFRECQGELEPRPGTAKPLSESEALYVAKLAQTGKLADAVMNYLAYAVPHYKGNNITIDPKYRRVVDECALFVFEHATPGYAPSQECREYLQRYAGGRPLTVELLRVAHQAWLAEEKNLFKRTLFAKAEERAESPNNFDLLSDGEIENLFNKTCAAAKDVRGF